MRKTQCDRIVRYIEDYGSITTLQAFTDLGCTRLASRIHDLKNRGYSFRIETVKSKNRYGEIVNYNRYSLKAGASDEGS